MLCNAPQECKVVFETVCSNSYGNSYSNNYGNSNSYGNTYSYSNSYSNSNSNSYSNSYNFPKRRKKRTVALVRNFLRAKQNIWRKKKQLIRNTLGLNRGRRVQAARRPYQSKYNTRPWRPVNTISRPVQYQGPYSTLF